MIFVYCLIHSLRAHSNMAGSISVPTIIPLRTPMPGQHKTVIDNETLIELHSG